MLIWKAAHQILKITPPPRGYAAAASTESKVILFFAESETINKIL